MNKKIIRKLACIFIIIFLQSCTYNYPISYKDYNQYNGIKAEARLWKSIVGFGYNEIVLEVYNSSKSPIEFNYYLDTFYITTKNGNKYKLDQKGILSYPESPINPGEKKEFKLGLPTVIWGTQPSDIKMIECKLYTKEFILNYIKN